MRYKKRDKTLGASSEENKESRNPYHDKGFRLSYDIEILFDIFSSEENQLLHFPLRNKTNVFLRGSFFF